MMGAAAIGAGRPGARGRSVARGRGGAAHSGTMRPGLYGTPLPRPRNPQQPRRRRPARTGPAELVRRARTMEPPMKPSRQLRVRAPKGTVWVPDRPRRTAPPRTGPGAAPTRAAVRPRRLPNQPSRGRARHHPGAGRRGRARHHPRAGRRGRARPHPGPAGAGRRAATVRANRIAPEADPQPTGLTAPLPSRS
jgi:hypothetical protein